MTHQTAHQLIDRYFAGETSLAEERQLQAYFRGPDVAPTLVPYAPLFRYWEGERQVAAPVRPAKTRRLPKIVLALAAALLLLLVARVVHQGQQPHLTAFPVAERQPVDWSRYEIRDEQQAVRFLHSVLKTTSEKMQQGTSITLRELREVEAILD